MKSNTKSDSVPSAQPTITSQLKALGHPVRWGIVERLAREPGHCACDFNDYFDISQPAVSSHLKILKEAGIVRSDRDGTQQCYYLIDGALNSLGAKLTALGESL